MPLTELLGGLTIAALWGATPALYKSILGRITPATLVLVYAAFIGICCLVWAAFTWPQFRRDLPNMRTADWGLLGAAAILGGFGASVLFAYLLARFDAHRVTALAYTAPVVTAVLAAVWLRESISATAAVGIGLVVVGVGLIAASDTAPR